VALNIINKSLYFILYIYVDRVVTFNHRMLCCVHLKIMYRCRGPNI